MLLAKYLTAALQSTSLMVLSKSYLPLYMVLNNLKHLVRKQSITYSMQMVKTQVVQQVHTQHYIHNDAAVRDALTITDAASVKNRWSELIEIATNILAPSKKIGRSAAKHVLYNRNYFLQEIETQTVAQFGAGSWIYMILLTILLMISFTILLQLILTKLLHTISLSLV